MTRAVWKFPLKATDSQEIVMPVGAKILTVQSQFGVPTLWAEVDPDETLKKTRIIKTIGTGQNFSPNAPYVYLGTAQVDGGSYIWHFYEAQ